jgi:TonB family protein
LDRRTRQSIVPALALLAACGSGHAKPQSTPFAAPTLPCNHGATVLNQVTPEFPDEVRGKLHEAQVAIAVDIAPSGRLRRARIKQSSSFPALDAAALTAAYKSSYLPAARNCKPIDGTFIFRVTFSAND